ncbi:unnamed protein product [Phytophthora fragariaefolia]|uniref:Unnamed protein product n=1 Tax=Phytophthora fragariaefolia TaxID=1490495 RepID=A0A9W7CYU0_9STRA|nr:unnamed protein product [Phytophthora fragariaefolia]
MARDDSQLLIEDMKSFNVVKSHLVPCGVCALTRPHKMRYQLLECASETCNAATPYDPCSWRGKVVTCQELNRVTILEQGAHETLSRDPHKPQLTPRLKDNGREMAKQGLKPARDRIDQLAFGPAVTDTQPFSFGWERNGNGKPNVGNGSDEDSFLVGFSTKYLFRNAARDPSLFVFHMNGTFKLNQVAYPRLEELYVKALFSLRRMFTAVTNKQLQLQYVMADAEAGQLNAIKRVFAMDSNLTYLMCFYHVMAKVYERLKAVTGSLREQVTADIYDMHFASSEYTYGHIVEKA